jgi:hypothetical protein
MGGSGRLSKIKGVDWAGELFNGITLTERFLGKAVFR